MENSCTTVTNKIPVSSPLLKAIFFSLIEKVSLRAAEVHDLGAAVSLRNNETRQFFTNFQLI